MNHQQKSLKTLFAILIFVGLIHAVIAAPSADLWETWTRNNPVNQNQINHEPWQEFLNMYLETQHASGINRVRYARVSTEDRQSLADYLKQMSQTQITAYSKQEQKAFWINLYNALTVQIILKNYPVQSIRDIKSGFFSFGPWDMKLMEIEGEKITLNDIEHRILRPLWQDNRVHYALNCASLGCPDLQPQAFTRENTETLLDSAARAFINHERGAKFEKDELVLSSIYHWFKTDFGGTDASVIEHLIQFADAPLAEKLRSYHESWDHDYDWKLNAAQP
ncbi:MAG: DUF547 domain-containing protein [SAR324 cluster bacterium]|nr:DUF547 domain-containing protein [SAR324 cluster bacterium]